jgi:glycine/D-amino acid oxidase-like deaminating enzyme
MIWQEKLIVTPEGDHDLPVIAEVDLVVVGAGAAGVAAAETAARRGLRVLAIERYGFCGGATVAGLSGTICGLYLSTNSANEKPQQVVFGFAERFRRNMIARGGLTEPQQYGKTWTVTHDPLVWRETAEGMLRDAKVDILYHSQVIGVVMEDDALRGVVLNTKSGRGLVLAKAVVDASGDGDVAFRAGLATTKGQDGRIQNPTMIFRLGGVDVPAFLGYWGPDTISQQKVIDQLVACDAGGDYALPRKKIWIFTTPRPNELMVNATRILGFDGRDLDPTDPIDHSEAEIVGRLQAREYARFLKDRIPGCQDSFINDTGVEVGIRQTRTVTGIDRLRNDDVLGRRKRADGIARSPWPIELHSGEKPKVEWLIDDFYEVPYGALVPELGENLIVAGRCIDCEHEALASARVTAQCFGYGQAAAIAAELAIRSERRFRDIDGGEIRRLLNAEGAGLD